MWNIQKDKIECILINLMIYGSRNCVAFFFLSSEVCAYLICNFSFSSTYVYMICIYLWMDGLLNLRSWLSRLIYIIALIFQNLLFLVRKNLKFNHVELICLVNNVVLFINQSLLGFLRASVGVETSIGLSMGQQMLLWYCAPGPTILCFAVVPIAICKYTFL